MQSVSSRIWTRVFPNISYDDNHYTMGTSYGFNMTKLRTYAKLTFEIEQFN